MKQVFKLFFLTFSFFTMFFSINVLSVETIKVGAYDFPPFVEWKEKVPSGMTVNLINRLNQIQNKYKFELFETSSKRRYEDFDEKNFDLMFFESIDWGWANKDVYASKVYMTGGEVFIALKEGHDQSYFDDLKGKSIRGIEGFHYGFANFSNKPDDLKKFNFTGTNSAEGNILALLFKRTDLAIVTLEYLNQFLLKYPKEKKNILISKKFDQVYKHTVLIRKSAKISVKEVNDLLDKLKKDKTFKF